MFLRRYSRTKNGKTHVYFALVQSTRTNAGPRQRVVAHLGELNHTQERRWQRTVVCYNRQGEAQPIVEQFEEVIAGLGLDFIEVGGNRVAHIVRSL